MLFNKFVVAGSDRLRHVCSRAGIRQLCTEGPQSPEIKADRKAFERATMHRTSASDKWLLVHFKKYPKGQVPDFVTQHLMERVRSMGRIKLNIVFGVIAILSAGFMVYMGKSEHKAGNTMTVINRNWHAEESRKLDEAAKKS